MRKKMVRVETIGLAALLVAGVLAIRAIPGDAKAACEGGRAPSGAGSTGFRGAVRQPTTPGAVITAGDVGPTDLSGTNWSAVMVALNDKYKARSTHNEVIADLGAVRPFVNIQKAEENHVTALEGLLDRHGIDVPPGDWQGSVRSFDSHGEACAAGLRAQIENADLCDALLKMVDNPEIIRGLEALQRASLTKHLPAFERCAP
jgi:hypothetical protein